MGNCTKLNFMAIHRSTSRAETAMTQKEVEDPPPPDTYPSHIRPVIYLSGHSNPNPNPYPYPNPYPDPDQRDRG